MSVQVLVCHWALFSKLQRDCTGEPGAARQLWWVQRDWKAGSELKQDPAGRRVPLLTRRSVRLPLQARVQLPREEGDRLEIGWAPLSVQCHPGLEVSEQRAPLSGDRFHGVALSLGPA